MKSKIASFIMTLLTILLIILIIFLGLIVYNKFFNEDIIREVQDFVTNVTTGEKIISEDIQNYQTDEGTLEASNNVVKQDDYYYSQLDNYSQIIYRAFEKNKEEMKTGKYQINLETNFYPILSQADGEELLGKCYQSAIESYTYDNPEVFYIDFSKLLLNIETTTRGTKITYKVFINSGEEDNYLTEEFQTKENIEEALEQIEKVEAYFKQNKQTDMYSNIKLVHDYLVESIEYDQTISKNNIYNIYGALINKECVCEGYAKAFKYLMKVLDIPCIIISGKGINSEGNTENHAWNYVQLNEKWYAIDCTWDDPIIIGPGFLSNISKYKYFLKGEEEFSQTHLPIGQFTEGGKVFELPVLSSNNY